MTYSTLRALLRRRRRGARRTRRWRRSAASSARRCIVLVVSVVVVGFGKPSTRAVRRQDAGALLLGRGVLPAHREPAHVHRRAPAQARGHRVGGGARHARSVGLRQRAGGLLRRRAERGAHSLSAHPRRHLRHLPADLEVDVRQRHRAHARLRAHHHALLARGGGAAGGGARGAPRGDDAPLLQARVRRRCARAGGAGVRLRLLLAVQHRRHHHQRLGPHAADDGDRRHHAGGDGGGGVDRHSRGARPRPRSAVRGGGDDGGDDDARPRAVGRLPVAHASARRCRRCRWCASALAYAAALATGWAWNRAGLLPGKVGTLVSSAAVGVVYLVVVVVTGELRPSELKRLRAK